MQDRTLCADNAKNAKYKITTKRQKQRNCVIWKIDECCTSVSLNQWAQGSSPWRCTKKNQCTLCTGFSFCLHDGRGSNKAAAHSAASNQPSGLLLSLRVPTARNVYRGSCGSKDFMAFLFLRQRLHTLAHFTEQAPLRAFARSGACQQQDQCSSEIGITLPCRAGSVLQWRHLHLHHLRRW